MNKKLLIIAMLVMLSFLFYNSKVNAAELEWVKIREYNDDYVSPYDMNFPRFEVEGNKLKVTILAYAESPSYSSIDIELYDYSYSYSKTELWKIRVDDDLIFDNTVLWPSNGFFNETYIIDDIEPGDYLLRVGGLTLIGGKSWFTIIRFLLERIFLMRKVYLLRLQM